MSEGSKFPATDEIPVKEHWWKDILHIEEISVNRYHTEHLGSENKPPA
jgi:hypothetical protein